MSDPTVTSETESDAPTEVDLALRAVTRLFPVELAAALMPAGVHATSPVWIETQVASRERRLDRLLAVIVGRASCWLHVEWMLSFASDIPFRMFEYHYLAAIAARRDAEAALEKARELDKKAMLHVATIESTLVLLTGRESPPWPLEMEYRSSPLHAPFAGVRFRVEAVYQRTLAELRARGILWLLFAPLAIDATPEALGEVVRELSGTIEARRFAEFSAAMLVLAETDQRERGLQSQIAAFLPREVLMQSSFLNEIRNEGRAIGKAEGKAEGEAKGKAEGEAKGKAEGEAKGKAEGEAKGKAEALLSILSARSLSITDAQRQRIESCGDVTALDRWIRVAVSASRTDDVLSG